METLELSTTVPGHGDTDLLLAELETELGLTLKAVTSTDTLNGYANFNQIYIDGDPFTVVDVHVYLGDEPPTSSDGSLKSVLDEIGLTMEEVDRETFEERMIPIMGGHTTTFQGSTTDAEEVENQFNLWAEE